VFPSSNIECSSYLDIETTGLNPRYSDLTVIGLYLENGGGDRVIQLVGGEISCESLVDVIKDIRVIYTYNGSRFDLPFIKAKLGVDLTRLCIHRDLMYDCWQRNLYGGLKNVERELGIKRRIEGVDGLTAVVLWQNYKLYGDKESLETLLEYNREDVMNLKMLRQKLNL